MHVYYWAISFSQATIIIFFFFFGIILNIFHSLGTCFCKEADVCTHVRTRIYISVSAHVL